MQKGVLGFWGALDDQGLMPTIPGDEISSGLFDELLELGERIAVADDERAAGFIELLGEIFQSVMQPPVRSTAGLPMSFGLRVMDEDRDDRAAMLHRRLKRRIVGETKIKAKPDDGRGRHGGSKGGIGVRSNGRESEDRRARGPEARRTRGSEAQRLG